MNRGPTVAALSLPAVDRYAGNCLIKPSSYYCGGGGGGGGGVRSNVVPETSSRGRFADTVVAGYRHHQHQQHHQHHQNQQQQHHNHHSPSTPYHHYQQLHDWYGRTAYWHHHNQCSQQGIGGGGPLLAEKANFAAHKHGAPLIQAAKYGCNSNGTSSRSVGGGGPGKKYAKKTSAEQPNGKKNAPDGGGGGGGSDESSGGAASENSLPRIIKPRKRRKKERKPVPAAVVQPLVIVAAAVQKRSDRSSSSTSSSSSSASSSPPPPPPPPPPPLPPPPPVLSSSLPSAEHPQHRRRPALDAVRLSADIKTVSLEDVSTCQCACCDPVGNVWDVGRRCFSPSLTRPEPARKSWSGESPPLQPKTPVTAAVAPAAARIRTHSLEVSSEIVTSHNGHRDIEIKFFTMPIGSGDHHH